MTKHHPYEFDRSKKSMTIFVLAKVLSNLLNLISIIAAAKLPDNWDFKSVIETCVLGKNQTPFIIQMFLKVFLQIPYF